MHIGGAVVLASAHSGFTVKLVFVVLQPLKSAAVFEAAAAQHLSTSKVSSPAATDALVSKRPSAEIRPTSFPLLSFTVAPTRAQFCAGVNSSTNSFRRIDSENGNSNDLPGSEMRCAN